MALETWMNEVVAKNADGNNDAIPAMIREGFQHSMRASIEYHRDLANSLKGDSDKTLARYHYLMSDMYRTLCE